MATSYSVAVRKAPIVPWTMVARTVSLLAMCLSSAHAGQYYLVGHRVATVAVNGGADTVNPGTTCIRMSSPVQGTCTGGLVAIPNNNKLLIAAALQAKATGAATMLYYEDNGSQHCPGIVFTPCSVISIELQ